MEPGVPAIAFPQAGDNDLTKQICNHTISFKESFDMIFNQYIFNMINLYNIKMKK